MHRLLIAAVLIAATAIYQMRTAPVRGGTAPDLSALDCTDITQSQLLKRVCYDAEHRYLLSEIAGRYYAQCNVDASTVDQLPDAESVPTFYITEIRAGHKCKAGDLPADIAQIVQQ